MSFAISFVDEPNLFLHDDLNIPSAVGRIVIGDFREEFVSTLSEWDRTKYEAQWTASLRQLLGGAERCVLITDFCGPERSNNLEWWALYRGEENVVYVQNQIPWFDSFERNFRVEEAGLFLKDRVAFSGAGLPISEWNITLSDVARFLDRSCGGAPV